VIILYFAILGAKGKSSGGTFEVNLDKRKLKTPNGKIFRVPNEALALAVAGEWNAQDKIIKRHNMHLVGKSCLKITSINMYFLCTCSVKYMLF
jgi:chaperone required for assembly of F1-ATPase